ncbi:MAG: Ig-like domain-containing protein [Nitrospirota bacterium]
MKMRHFLRFVVGSTLIALLSSCAQTSNLIKGVNLTQITITPSRQILPLGQESLYTAEGTWSNGEVRDISKEVTWHSSNTGIATFFKLDGRDRAIVVGVGTTTITATMGSIKQTATLRAISAPIKALQISSPRYTIEVGQRQAFTAIANLTGGTHDDFSSSVVWSSSDKAIAIVSDVGWVTALSPGVTFISAGSGQINNVVQVTIPTPTLKGIEVSPNSASIAAGLSQSFIAKGNFSNNTIQTVTSSVTWKSSNPTIVTLDANGVATAVAKGVKKPQIVTITAISDTITQSASLTVTAPELAKIQVLPKNAAIASGLTQAFSAEGVLTDKTALPLTQKVKWVSSDPAILMISPAGVAKALAPGKATITAQLGDQSGATSFTTEMPALTEIRVSPAIPFVASGLKQLFTAEGTFTDGTVNIVKDNLSWSSSDPTLATIDPMGLATTLAKGVQQPKTVTITAALGKISGKSKLTITAPELIKIDVTPAIPFVAAGKGQQFSAQGILTDDTTQPLSIETKWTSSDPSIVTISQNGFAKVIAKGITKPQAVTITAFSDKVIGMAKLTVTAPEITTLLVTPSIPFVAAGKTVQFIAEGILTDETRQQSPTGIIWSSSDTTAVTIDPKTGLATTLSPKVVTITAAVGSIQNQAKLTVTDAELTGIQITPEAPTVMAGKTLTFSAAGTFTDGTNRVPPSMIWVSSDPSAATIDRETGLVTALAASTVTITASSGLIQSTKELTVIAPELLSIRIHPDKTTMIVGRSVLFSAQGQFSDQTTRLLTSDVTWLSSDPSFVSVKDGPKGGGIATALGVGEITLSAISGKVIGTIPLSVIIPKLTAIKISSDRASLPAGLQLQLTASGSFTDDVTRPLSSDVTWRSSDPLLVSIDSNGLLRAIAQGVESLRGVTITAASATSSDGQMVVGTTVIIIMPPELTKIMLKPAEASLETGQSQPFSAAGLFSDETTEEPLSNIIWHSSDPSLVTITNEGIVTVVGKVETPQTITITASSGKIVSTANVIVIPAYLTEIHITPSETSIAAGRSLSFATEGVFSDKTTKSLEFSRWSSSDANIATVDEKTGRVSTISPGVVTITASLEKIQGMAHLTVTIPELTEFQIAPLKFSVISGGTLRFIASGLYTDQKVREIKTKVKWSSSDTSVAAIDEDGIVTSSSRGVDDPLTVRITAAFEEWVSTTTLTVTPK